MKRALSVIAVLVAAAVMYFFLWRTTNVATPPPKENSVADKIEDRARAKEEKQEASRDEPSREAPPSGETKPLNNDPPGTRNAAEPRDEDRAAAARDRSGGAGQTDSADTTDGGNPIYAPTNTGIRDAVRASIPELKECYESWLKLSPELKGKTTFSFAIVTDAGKDAGLPGEENLAAIREVKLQSSTVGHAFMEGCIARVFEDLRFQPPAGGRLEVTYPLMFDNAPDGK